MTLSIIGTLITSDITHHLARCPDSAGWDGWKVSWIDDKRVTQTQAIAAVELAEIVAKGRDGGPDTTNYSYLTWQRVKELAEVLGVVPLKTVLYLEGLEAERKKWGMEVALTDKQRREVENLRSLTVDIERRLTNAINEAEAVLPPGAIPGMLGDAADSVETVRQILDSMVKRMEETGD